MECVLYLFFHLLVKDFFFLFTKAERSNLPFTSRTLDVIYSITNQTGVGLMCSIDKRTLAFCPWLCPHFLQG